MHFLTLFNGAGCFMGAFFVQTAHTGTQGKNMPMTGVPEQFANPIDYWFGELDIRIKGDAKVDLLSQLRWN